MNAIWLQEIAMLCLRRTLPLALTALIALVSLVPLESSGLMVATGPMLALSILLFWLLARPTDVPAWSMFLCGLMFDAAGGGPLGLWSLSFVIGFLVARFRGDDTLGTTRVVSLVIYASAAGLAALTAWAAASVYIQGLADPASLIAGSLIAAGFYLVLTVVFGSWLAMPTRFMERM